MSNLFSKFDEDNIDSSLSVINNRIADYSLHDVEKNRLFYDVLQWGADMHVVSAFEKLRSFFNKKTVEPFDFASEIKKRKAEFDSEYLIFDFFGQKWMDGDNLTPDVMKAKLYTKKETKDFLDNFQGPESPYRNNLITLMAFRIPPDGEQYGCYLPIFFLPSDENEEG